MSVKGGEGLKRKIGALIPEFDIRDCGLKSNINSEL